MWDTPIRMPSDDRITTSRNVLAPMGITLAEAFEKYSHAVCSRDHVYVSIHDKGYHATVDELEADEVTMFPKDNYFEFHLFNYMATIPSINFKIEPTMRVKESTVTEGIIKLESVQHLFTIYIIPEDMLVPMNDIEFAAQIKGTLKLYSGTFPVEVVDGHVIENGEPWPLSLILPVDGKVGEYRRFKISNGSTFTDYKLVNQTPVSVSKEI